MKIVSAILKMVQKDKNVVTADELYKEDPQDPQDAQAVLEANIIEYEEKLKNKVDVFKKAYDKTHPNKK